MYRMSVSFVSDFLYDIEFNIEFWKKFPEKLVTSLMNAALAKNNLISEEWILWK